MQRRSDEVLNSMEALHKMSRYGCGQEDGEAAFGLQLCLFDSCPRFSSLSLSFSTKVYFCMKAFGLENHQLFHPYQPCKTGRNPDIYLSSPLNTKSLDKLRGKEIAARICATSSEHLKCF
ncbi:hypothetical protein MRB53_029589 [Persea americana]|uniref:Uncharacterized protein n=1 Tax=Persea americana TaxID=3435 RepID=A0ACC2KIU0_PERAE|nr:hypothetical protein MRB53_029589 [Persea americana]